jgi:long-chain acyl-CoA synthetase
MYYPRWTQSWWQNTIRNIVYTLFIRWAVGVFAWPRIRGKEKLRSVRGPVIFICNHITQFDVGWVLWTLPLRLRWKLAVAMEGEYMERLRKPAPELSLFTKLFQRFEWFAVVAWFNAFPMASRSGVRESFAYAGESADRGYSLLIYPEGQRTKHGGMNPFRAGIGLLAQRLHLPIVPMRIDGLFEYKEKKAKWIPPFKVRFTIGSPLRFAPGAAPAEITRSLESALAALEWKLETGN